MGDVYKAMIQSGSGSLLNDPDQMDSQSTHDAWQSVAENALRLKVACEGKMVEQFDLVRVKLLKQAAERRLQIHAITSSMAGEGRTSCALHLALSFARMPGTRVLVVDMDSQSRNGLLDCFEHGSQTVGLSEFVTGQVTSLDAITWPTDMPGLHVMPYGHAKTATGSTLLEHPRLGQMLERCRDLYDHVVIDAPAVLGQNGAKRMGQLADQMLMAVALRKTPANELERAKCLLADHHCQITGIVLTERK